MADKWLQGAVDPKKRGMFNGRSEQSLQSQESKLRASGPHPAGSPAATKEHELSFAIRAKKGGGFTGKKRKPLGQALKG